MMTVGELREMLEDYVDDAEVRLMMHQSWPFENGIHGVCRRDEMVDLDEDEDDTNMIAGEKYSTVFIVEGSQICYGNKAAWDSCQ